MRHIFVRVVGALLMAGSVCLPTVARAQAAAPVVEELMKNIDAVQQKFVALAKAMPANKYAWRPMPGVRSVSEVFLHVASDNYLLPSMVGAMPPAGTNIDVKNFKTLETFEKRTLTRDETVQELQASFAHLKTAMRTTTADKLTAPIDMFGQKSTQQSLWIETATHMHEHLGQAIAYARMNRITPPWSK